MTPRVGRSQNPWGRFADKVDVGVCMEWTATTTNDGYGRFRDQGVLWLAHRWVWTHLFGPIPDDLSVDHLCRNPRCVDPDHLRLLPIYDNVMDGYNPTAKNLRKTHCKWGHEFTPENIVPTGPGKAARKCRTCKRARERDNKRRQRAAHAA